MIGVQDRSKAMSQEAGSNPDENSGSAQGVRCGGGEKWLDSGHILRAKPTGF